MAVQNCSHACTVHTDRKNSLLYDALVFHGWDRQSPPKQRDPSQVYIMFLHESPYYGGDNYIKGDHFYNWSASYHRKSDIWIPYWNFKRGKHESKVLPEFLKYSIEPNNLDLNRSFVVWVVSSCQTPGQREKYVDNLRKFINVDIYGKCGKPCPDNGKTSGRVCLESLAATGKYKFYLAFENAVCRWYITEKAQRPLLAGLVPIVYGGFEKMEYIKTLPPNSFIDVRDFTSPEQLAKYLLYLSTNTTAYMAYHAWRTDYIVWPGVYHDVLAQMLCSICQALHNGSMMSPRNVNWGRFWNKHTECDDHFIDKVIGETEIKNYDMSSIWDEM